MTTSLPSRPPRTDAAEYYFRYIDLVPDGDIRDTLGRQRGEVAALFARVPDSRGLFRYAPGKWSLNDVIGHVTDTERVLVSRAHWFARGFESPLPSFEQEVAVQHAGADRRTLASLVEGFDAVRGATVDLFGHLPPEAWTRTGTASGYSFTVAALAYIVAGHVEHHLRQVREHYLANDAGDTP